MLRVEAGGRPIAVVLSDRLRRRRLRRFATSVAEALLLASENRRLTAELQASLEQVRDSRARILAAGDDTRRRIERDLHDGAQQLLISTGIKLNLAAAQAERGTAALGQVLDEARLSSTGRWPSSATWRAGSRRRPGARQPRQRATGAGAALGGADDRRVTGDREPDERAAATVYFVVAECLTNVAKHAGASRATVEVELEDPVGIRVTDDGRGGATPGRRRYRAAWPRRPRRGPGWPARRRRPGPAARRSTATVPARAVRGATP